MALGGTAGRARSVVLRGVGQNFKLAFQLHRSPIVLVLCTALLFTEAMPLFSAKPLEMHAQKLLFKHSHQPAVWTHLGHCRAQWFCEIEAVIKAN
jgi:hypothetical protein